MPSNTGATTLKRSRHTKRPMAEYDCLPRELRVWLAGAALPWRARSVREVYARAVARTGSPKAAIAELDRLQAGLIAKDAARVWGDAHPAARMRAKR